MKENPGLRLGRDGLRLETQKNQRLTRNHRIHPRGLARSVAKGLNRMNSQTENEISSWREDVAALPKRGQRYLHPERHK